MAIFLAVELEQLNLPAAPTYVMLAYVIFHVLVHIVLTVQKFHIYRFPKDRKVIFIYIF